jgi:Phage integrase family.
MATFNRDKKSGVIYIHQQIDGKRFRTSTGIRVSEKNWAGEKATNNLVMYKGTSVNGWLKQCEMALNLAIQDLTQIGGDRKKLKELYLERIAGKRTIRSSGSLFMPYFKEYCEGLKSGVASTHLSYQTTYRMLEKYFGLSAPTFNDIDLNFYDKFGRWMITIGDLSMGSISNQWKHIKHIMRVAFDRGEHKNDAFKNFTRKEEVSDNIALTKKEIKKIENALLSDQLDKVRDWFLVQCYTGVAFVDIMKVNSSNITGRMLSYRRDKSDETANVPVHPKVAEILKKHKGTLPEIISNQKYNDYLKSMCETAKITDPFNSRITKGGKKVKSVNPRWKEVSSHTGRRTFATQLVLEGIPVHLIMLMTGHKTLDSFDKYVKLRDLQGKMELSKLKFFK